MHRLSLLSVIWFAFVASGLSRETARTRGVGRDIKQAYGSTRSNAGCVYIGGIDFYGSDISDGVPTTSNPACCDLCEKNPSCVGWTRTVSGICYLKSKLKEPTICKHCDASGFRKTLVISGKLEIALARIRDAEGTPLGTKAAINGLLARNTGDYGG
ncbi:hypothetical protein BSKO_08936 [Bryopsis sp. KO-2023]|nr:hypothetical protein BSKO_08936 [Bryopsis sp. KO-2023]